MHASTVALDQLVAPRARHCFVMYYHAFRCLDCVQQRHLPVLGNAPLFLLLQFVPLLLLALDSSEILPSREHCQRRRFRARRDIWRVRKQFGYLRQDGFHVQVFVALIARNSGAVLATELGFDR